MTVLYVLGYFNRNKQNSYAALNKPLRGVKCVFNKQLLETVCHKIEESKTIF